MKQDDGTVWGKSLTARTKLTTWKQEIVGGQPHGRDTQTEGVRGGDGICLDSGGKVGQ